jgi:cell fate (sporulation/competence/biofilm development) regulator YlbF (YheA/YmcA/DUF963 family)
MDEILAAAKALAETLRNGTLYKDYRKNRIRVAENPELSARMLDFKKKQAAFEMKRLQNQPVTFDDEKFISHLYAEMTQNETARKFLASEEAFLEAYRQVMEMLGEACEIDVFI